MSQNISQSRAFELRNRWLSNSDLVDNASPSEWISAITQLNALGDPFSATELAARAIQIHPEVLGIHQQRALAFLRCGATKTARRLLHETLELFGENPETLSLLGRSYKTDTIDLPVPDDCAKHLKKALTYYDRAWRLSKNTYPGINAATIAFLLGETDSALDLAQKIRESCEARLANERNYWLLATLGEANLLLQNLSEAREAYVEARSIAKDHWADIASTRKQARIILRAIGENLSDWDSVFALGAIAIFSGHVADPAGIEESQKRITPEDIEPLRNAIDSWVREKNVCFGFSGAASGGDLLFLESVIKHGGDAHVVLPFSIESFEEICVAPAPGSLWRKLFRSVINNASSVNILNPSPYSGDTVDFEFSSKILLGKALLIGDQIDQKVCGLSVWDGKEARGRGGTAQNLAEWKQNQIYFDNFWKQSNETGKFELKVGGDNKALFHTVSPAISENSKSKETKAILFADVSGYTRLPEAEIPSFVSNFLGLCHRLITTPPFKADVANTWGDALFAIFPSTKIAADFATRLMNEAKMDELFSVDLHLRIGLHAGPLYECFDPIQQCITYTGSHVSTAARLEPIAELGQIYASEYFAAVAKTEGLSHCRFEYLGEKRLDKGAEPMRIYKLV